MIHLHLHDVFSLLDGAGLIKENIKRAKELGMTSIAQTNHNHLCGVIEFVDECKKNDIKPIIGCEMYQTWDTEILSLDAKVRKKLALEKAKAAGVEIPEKINKKKITQKQINELIADYEYDTKQYHLVLLAMNQTGYKNLCKLQSKASEVCTYNGRYCCDMDMLRKYNEGLICLSACLGGMIPSSITKGDFERAENLIKEYKEIFGDRFYLEIQPLNITSQCSVNMVLESYAKEYDIPLVATNDVHYTYKEDIDDHDTLLCIGIGKTKNEQDRMRYLPEFWLRSEDEMIEAFKTQNALNENVYLKAINNTSLIADRISNDITLRHKETVLPKIKIPHGLTASQYFTLQAWQNLYKYYIKHPEINIKEYQMRLDHELYVINTKGYADYMLLVKSLFDFAKDNQIPTGPGRGSASGSLALFLLGVTKVIDPIKYNLLFFRFLTIDRKDLPDIDSDFSYYGRDKIIKHLEDEFTPECVAHIGTITELGVKSGIKDFGRVFDYSFSELNEISKIIDEVTDKAPSVKFEDIDNLLNEAEYAKEENNIAVYERLIAKYNKFKEIEEKYKELFRLCRKFEGVPRNLGVHASGVLATPIPVSDLVPLRKDPKTGVRICLFTGPQLESCNLVKLDILGLKTLDVLDKTLKSVNEKLTVDDLYEEIENHLDDKDIFKLLQNKETEGIFQIESDMFKGIVDAMQPTDINDVIALLSIG